jgi:type I restriction enzyme, S subunit
MIEYQEMPNGWAAAIFEDLLDYTQPTKFIVGSTEYDDKYKIPVLTAGKSFILGHTNERHGIFTEVPVIIFDDFTTATQFVNFQFKVKSSAMKILKPTCELVCIKYLFYFMQTIRVNADTHKRYWISHYAKLPVALPPLPEQHRIVAKIEEMFSSLDKGIESLKNAQQQLKVYRQAVLKWAFEGKLTNKNIVDGELPDGWKWVKIDYFLSDKKKGMATGPFGMMLKKNEHKNSGVPVLGIENIGEGVFQMPNKIFITSEKAKELNSFRVKANDIIISRSGTVGEICLVPEKMKGSIISTNLIKVSINQEVLSPKYFVYLFQGGKVRQQVFNLCKGSSRAFLNQTILKSLDFPYCPLPEQNAIVAEIESRLSVCDKIEESIEQSLIESESLRQSILKKTFEGKLVPQNPSDEPALKLLERIKAEKEKNKKVKN